MADFSSNIRLLPEDTITPAIGNLTNTLMQAEAIKRQEDERKMARLTELATIAIGDVTTNDNLYLQGEKEKFLKKTTDLYREYNGRLPYEKQAELNAGKQQIVTAATKAEQDKKDYYEVVKKMATDPNINKDKTGRYLSEWMKTPITQRESPYSAVRLNFDVPEYLKKNIIADPKKWTELSGDLGAGYYDIERYAKEDVLTQMGNLYKANSSFRTEIDDRMAEAGVTPKTMADVMSFMDKEKLADPFVKDNVAFKRFPQRASTVVNNYAAANNGEKTPTNFRVLKSSVSPKGGKEVDAKNNPTGKIYEMNLETGDMTVLKNVSVSFADPKHDFSFSNYGENIPSRKTTNLNMEINGVQSLRSYYDKKSKRWFPATVEWMELHPNEDTYMKNWIVGSKGEEREFNNKLTGKKEYKMFYDLAHAVPATRQNITQVEKQLGKNAKIDDSLVDDFNDPTIAPLAPTEKVSIGGKTYTVAELRQNPANTDEVIRQYLNKK